MEVIRDFSQRRWLQKIGFGWVEEVWLKQAAISYYILLYHIIIFVYHSGCILGYASLEVSKVRICT